ncbi:MAG: Extracellular solute-binding protein family 1 [Parcubacteria group bacterium GW2011_GWA2_45_30]|nr:MAG: Extracellular solute-binding protein family 1 [Parcubacteria group bacterium GW2011_GWA2_45_30]
MADQKTIVYAVFGVVGLIVVLLVFGFLFGREESESLSADLKFWGYGDDEYVWRDIISGYAEKYSGSSVTYTRLNDQTYEDTIVNRLAAGTGPDIFMLKNTAVVKHADKIVPLPQDYFQFYPKDFKKTFADIATDELLAGPQNAFLRLDSEQIVGFPLYVDALALFYHKDLFNSSGIATPPVTWDDLLEASRKVTKLAFGGGIEKAGAALGTYANVERAFEILSSLLMQQGSPIIDRRTKDVRLDAAASNVLQFYTSFSNQTKQNYSWSGRMPNSFEALARGDAAIAFGTATDMQRILAKNPHLRLGIAVLPQRKGSTVSVTQGEYAVLAVSRLSPNPLAAWQFIRYATDPEQSQKYLEKTLRAPARRDLIAKGTSSEALDVFYRSALIAKSWPVPDERRTKFIFQDAVESILSGASDPSRAAQNLSQQLQLLLPK